MVHRRPFQVAAHAEDVGHTRGVGVENHFEEAFVPRSQIVEDAILARNVPMIATAGKPIAIGVRSGHAGQHHRDQEDGDRRRSNEARGAHADLRIPSRGAKLRLVWGCGPTQRYAEP